MNQLGATIDPRAAGSYLGERNPVIKLAVLLILSLSLTAIFDPYTPAAILVLALLAGVFLGRLGLGRMLRYITPLLIAVLGILIANILFGRSIPGAEHILVQLGPIKVTVERLTIGGSIGLRVLAFAALSLDFVLTTDPSDLILGLVQQVRLNYRVAYGVMVGYRMLPLLASEYEHIRAAQRVRGVVEGGGLRGSFTRLRRYAVPLLAGGVRRAGRVALAMDARAFGAFPTRTYRRRITVERQDWLFAVLALLAVAAVVVFMARAGITRFGVGV